MARAQGGSNTVRGGPPRFPEPTANHIASGTGGDGA
jgi:hypothetical protein